MNQLYLDLLKQFITLKSVSTDAKFKSEVELTARWLSELFQDHGFKSETITGYGNPIVLAEYIADEEKETCLIYGHYDVQPADKSEGWNSEPFELKETSDKLIARGVVDNKGQTLIHIVNIFELIKEGKLKYNIKFMLEGDEETGSPNLPEFVKDNKGKLKADFIMVSDGPILGENPVIEVGFRGGLNTTLKIKTAKTDMHSGMFGGVMPSASLEASKFIAKLFDTERNVAIPGFYDNVDEVPKDILENNSKLPYDESALRKMTGVKTVFKDDKFDYFTKNTLQPTIEVTGLQSGYTGEGYRNGIPAEAVVKVNFRLVKSQSPEDMLKKYEDFIKDVLPDYVEYDLVGEDLYEGVKVDVDNKFIKETKVLLENSFEKEAFFVFSGGGLPIVTLFEETLKVPQVLVPLVNEDCNMHGADENFRIEILDKAMKFSFKFFSV